MTTSARDPQGPVTALSTQHSPAIDQTPLVGEGDVVHTTADDPPVYESIPTAELMDCHQDSPNSNQT